MKIWKTGLVFGACAACCAAPVLLGSSMAVLVGGGLGFAFWGTAGAVAVTAGLAAALLWRRQSVLVESAKASCGCDNGSGSGMSCSVDTPAPAKRLTASWLALPIASLKGKTS